MPVLALAPWVSVSMRTRQPSSTPKAVDRALGSADDGDLVLLFVADVERALERVNEWV